MSVQDERTAERLLLERRLEAQRMVAIHPSAGSPLKSWPLRQWAAVADALVEQGLRVLLTGGPGDMSLLEQIRNEVRLEAAVLADQPLGVMAAVFERCAVVVGPDNGPLHLAWSRGVPTVRLYGPASPAIYGPWPPHPSQRVLITNALPCVPCGNLVDPPCGARQNPPCLRDISVEAVLEAVRAATRERTAWSLS